MVKPYFDNVVRNKPRHYLKTFHEAYITLNNGDVYFVSLRETQILCLYKLYVFDEHLKYLFETTCSYGDYEMVLKTIRNVYKFSEHLPF